MTVDNDRWRCIEVCRWDRPNTAETGSIPVGVTKLFSDLIVIGMLQNKNLADTSYIELAVAGGCRWTILSISGALTPSAWPGRRRRARR